MKLAPPVIWRSGRTVTPGARMSIRKAVRLRCRGSLVVRQIISPTSARWAPDVQTFCPLTRQPAAPLPLPRHPDRLGPDRGQVRARPGSLNSWQAICCPLNSRGSQYCFCCSVPCRTMVGATMPRLTVSAESPGTRYCRVSRSKARA